MPIYRNDTSTAIVEKFHDTNGARISFRIEPGDLLTTEFILTDANLTEVDAAPYFNPLQSATVTATSTGTGDDQTVSIDMNTEALSILNQGDGIVVCFLRATANTPGINCYPWTERVINVGHNVDQIVLQFAVAGTVYVEQRKQ